MKNVNLLCCFSVCPFFCSARLATKSAMICARRRALSGTQRLKSRSSKLAKGRPRTQAQAGQRPKAGSLGQTKGCRSLWALALSLRMRVRAKRSNLRHDPSEQGHHARAILRGRARQSTHWQICPRERRDCGHRNGQRDRCGDHVACQIRHLDLRERFDQLRKRRVLARKALQH